MSPPPSPVMAPMKRCRRRMMVVALVSSMSLLATSSSADPNPTTMLPARNRRRNTLRGITHITPMIIRREKAKGKDMEQLDTPWPSTSTLPSYSPSVSPTVTPTERTAPTSEPTVTPTAVPSSAPWMDRIVNPEPTNETDESFAPNPVVMVNIPKVSILFTIQEMARGTPLAKKPFENMIFNFLEYMLADVHVAVNLDLESTIYYDPPSGKGTIIVTGIWMGHGSNVPSESTFLGAFRGWGTDALLQELAAAGFAMDQFEVQINNIPVESDTEPNTNSANNPNTLQEGQHHDDDDPSLVFVILMPMIALICCLPWCILCGNVIRSHLVVLSTHETFADANVSKIRRRPTKSECRVIRRRPSLGDPTTTTTSSPRGGRKRAIPLAASFTDDDSGSSQASSSSGYSGLFVGPKNETDLSAMYFL